NQRTSESRISGVGRSEPGGGIWLPLNLRIAASKISGSFAMSSGDILSNAMPAVRSSRLWQSTQYLPSRGQSCSGCGRISRCRKYITGPIATKPATAKERTMVWRLGMLESVSLDHAAELAQMRPRAFVDELQEFRRVARRARRTP